MRIESEPLERESEAPEVNVFEAQAPEVDHGALAPQHYPLAEGLHVSNLNPTWSFGGQCFA